jgi:hypothetical protein
MDEGRKRVIGIIDEAHISEANIKVLDYVSKYNHSRKPFGWMTMFATFRQNADLPLSQDDLTGMAANWNAHKGGTFAEVDDKNLIASILKIMEKHKRAWNRLIANTTCLPLDNAKRPGTSRRFWLWCVFLCFTFNSARATDQKKNHLSVPQALVNSQPVRVPVIEGKGVRFTHLPAGQGLSQVGVAQIISGRPGLSLVRYASWGKPIRRL